MSSTQRSRGFHLWGLLVSLATLSGGGARATDVVQQIVFPSAPAWYFVALQVHPVDSRVTDVFPADLSSFSYDRIWSFDSIEGWRHFAPGSDPVRINDLTQIEALRGYWIHVTEVPPGGQILSVTGAPIAFDRIEGAGWHAIGAKMIPGSSPQSVSAIFSDLGPALMDRVLALWNYDAASRQFSEIQDFSAACGTDPTSCLAPARAYWLLSDGTIELGREFTVTPECVVLTPEQPLARIEISYRGVNQSTANPASGSLQITTPEAGLRFLPVERSRIDGTTIQQPNLSIIGADGPDTCSSPACAGSSDCMNLCFATASSGPHVFFLSIDPVKLGSLGMSATNLADTDCAGGATYAEMDLRLNGEVAGAARIGVAVKPPGLLGEYVGALTFDEGSRSEVPLQLRLEECSLSGAETYPASCTAQDHAGGAITAFANPTLQGSTTNARDDDLDGDIDEAGENRAVRRRDMPGFANSIPFHGSVSPDGEFIRLEAGAPLSADLAFAGLSGAQDAGFAGLFAVGVMRNLALDGRRIGPATFAGVFSDLYTNVPATGGATPASLISTGRFSLTKSSGPQCVLDPPGSARPVPLGVPCRTPDSWAGNESANECPARCTGSPDVEGLSCSLDVPDPQCSVDVIQNGVVVRTASGMCQRYSCQYIDVASEPNTNDNLRRESRSISVSIETGNSPPPAGALIVDVEGPVDVTLGTTASSAGGEFALPALPCGSYTVRVRAGNCAEQQISFDPCSTPGNPSLPLSCSGTPDLSAGQLSHSFAGGPFTLRAGPGHLAGTQTGTFRPPDPASPLLLWPAAAEPVAGARDFPIGLTPTLRGPGTPIVIRAGLLSVLED